MAAKTRLTLATAGIGLCVLGTSLPAQTTPYDDSLLSRVQTAARAIPGELPRSVRYLAFAETGAPLRALVSGSDSQRVSVVYPVFQIRFRDRWIMVDAGFDRAIWDQFVRDQAVTYWQDRYDVVQQALRDAEQIVLTHEHWDHAAGVERTPYYRQVTSRALVTHAQLQSLLGPPGPYYLHLAPDSAPAYRTIDYDVVYSLASGVVLIKAAGHTPGSQILYVHLASGQELLLVGDLVWNMAGLEQNRQKPEGTSQSLKEDRQALQQQMDWVRRITTRGSVVALPSHDRLWLETLAARGLIANDLDLSKQ